MSNRNSTSEAELYYKERVLPEDEEHIAMICDIASKHIHEEFKMGINSKYLVMTIYGTVYSSIIEVLKEAQKQHEKCFIRIAKRLLIGYGNNSSDEKDTEKVGNFTPYMENLIRINATASPYETEEETEEVTSNEVEKTPYSLCTEWMVKNKEDHYITVMNMIADKALKALSDKKIMLRFPIFIIPLFSLIHESIINYAFNYRQSNNKTKFEFNVLGYYTVRSFIDDKYGLPQVGLIPIVESKTSIKSDGNASQKYE